MKIKQLLYLTLLFLASKTTMAAAPTWSVNPALFQYSMTAVTVANVNCVELTNPSVRIGAFVGTELRGTALTSTVLSGRYTASMVIYSNVTSNETVTFKMYNPTTDSIYDARVSVAFQDNANYGSSGNPFEVKSNNAPTAMQLSNNSINEGVPTNTTVGTFTSTDIDAGETFTYSLVSGSGSTDNANFNFSGNALRSSSVFNFGNKTSHNIRVRATDANGCFFESTHTINIIDVNTAPSDILITDSTVNENSAALTVVGSFSALDNDLSDTYSYTLVAGVGSTDNASFNINGTNLRTLAMFNYEVKSSYSIRVRVTDGASNTFDRVFTVLIDDINDAPTNIMVNGNSNGTTFMENKPLGSVIANLTTTDEDVANTFTYSFVNTPGNNNSDFTIIGSQLRTNILFDYETRQNYVVFVQTNDGSGGLFTKQLLLTVTDSNDAPTAINLTNNSITENLPANTFVAKLSATDPDGSGTYTYTFVNGTGSSGNANFVISNDSLYTASSFDFETTASYSIRINVNDGSNGTFQQAFSINVINANDIPTDINITSNQIAENLPTNTAVGTLSTADQDATNTFIYSLVSGVGSTDNASFNISGNTLRSSVSFDYETKNSYSVRVRTIDNGSATFEKVFTINVTDVVDAPTNMSISNDTINENLPANTLVGTLNGVSQDPSAVFTYSFDNSVTGNNNSSFIISGNQVLSNGVFDYETKNVYTLYINASTGPSSSFTKLIQIHVRNQNDAPTELSLSNNSVKENKAIGTFIGVLTSTDADANSTFTYALASGIGATHNNMFSVRNDSLFTAVVFDYEQLNLFSIRLKTTDNGSAEIQKVFAINIIDSNDAPTAIGINNLSVTENLAAGTTIGTISTTDADANQSFTYTLVAGVGATNNNLFNIQGSQLRTAASFNFETQQEYKIRVQTNDGQGGIYADTFTITIVNANDAPTNISISNNILVENRPVNSVIGAFTTTDEDLSDVFVYSFSNVTGNDNSAFFINGNQLRSNSNFNFEGKQVYNVYIQTSDGVATFTKQFVINIADSNDAPTDIALGTQSLNENKPVGSFIGQFSTTDADAVSSFAYTLTSGVGATNNTSFYISNDSLYSAAILNFELQNSFSIRVSSTDNGGLSFQKVFTITVNDSNDAPTGINLTASSISENQPIGTTVATINTVDADAGQTFTYALVAGAGSTNNSLFSIQNGLLKTNTIFNYELKQNYTIRIQTNDGNGGTFTDTFNITVLNANDAPTNITMSNLNVTENKAIGSFVGSFTTTDEDTSDMFSYSFVSVGTNDNSSFLITGNELRTNATFNYETKQLYVVNIQTNDGNGGTHNKQFLININDSNDAPTDIILSSNTIIENQPALTFISKLSTTDVDAGASTFTYTLVSGVGATHNSSFVISNDSLYSNTSFNYEQLATLSIRVRSTDNGSLSTEKVFTIGVNDANDAPTALSLSNVIVSENVLLRTRIGILSTTDADLTNTHNYSLVTGVGSTDNASFIIIGNELKTNVALNYEVKKVYQVRVQTNDNNGGTFDQTFTINVNDSNDAPTNIILSNNSFAENRLINSVVGSFSTVDEDSTDSFIYSFANVTGNDNSAFYLNGNQLRSNSSFDFETKQIYTLYVQTTDGYATFTKQFVINITDSNDAPTNVSLNNITVDENRAPNAFVGLIYSSDADANNTFTYTLVSGNGGSNNNSFIVRNDSLLTASMFDFEQKASYSIRLRTTDNGGLSYEKQFEITILNTNDTPTDITLSANEITENRLSRTAVGRFTTTDQDVTNNYTYTFVPGAGDADNADFVIVGAELRSNRIFNYENKSAYTIRIQSNDGNGGTVEKAFNVVVIDSNDAPSNIVLSTNIIAENLPVSSKVCDLSTIDQDANDAFLYSFANVTGNNNSNFFIIGNELRTTATFDYETKNFYLVVLSTTDAAGTSFTKQFIINIKDSVDAPTAIDLGNNNVSENMPVDEFVGLLSATDPDQTIDFNFSLVNGLGATDNASFKILGDSLITNATFNFEAKKLYNIRVRVTDATHAYFEKTFTININDENDAPTALVISNNTLQENKPVLTEIGSFNTSDVDAVDAFTYSLIAGTGSTDNAMFIIEGSTLRSNFSANFENKSSYSVRVSTTDKGGLTFENVFVVDVIDVSEKPMILNQTFTVSESDSANTILGNITASSPDAGANLQYSLTGKGSEYFDVDATTGALTNVVTIDYEKNRRFDFKVIVTDLQAIPLYDTANITINVSDQIEVKQKLPANNYMSPNNDGVNDVFAIDNPQLYADYSLAVYNEGGLEVFSVTNNYQNNWGATYNGKTLPTGVYFYVFYNSKTGDKFTGALNIVNQ